MSKKVVFIGKLPDPIGGVTVFNQRMSDYLKVKNKYTLKIIEPKYTNVAKISFLLRSNSEIHLSVSNFLLICIVSAIAKNNSVHYYDHNSSRHLEQLPNYKIKIFESFLLKKCKSIVLVSDHLVENYKPLKTFELFKSKIKYIPAFLPPSEMELPKIISTYNDSLKSIYNQSVASNKRNVIISSAFQPSLDNEGKDIYSIEKLIDIFCKLSKTYKQYYFVIAIGSYNSSEFSSRIKILVNKSSDSYSNLFFLEHNKQIWPLFKISRLFIRATTTDGDSVSLKEAIYYGSKVLASDVVPRPKGINLLNLDNDDLEQEIIKNIN